jgi:hypothetical protein
MVGTKGYTLVEVMIFLAVSTALFVSATSLIGGRQRSIKFSEAMRDLESKIQSIVGEVSNGYYPNFAGLKCVLGPSGVSFSDGGTNAAIGQNQDCILLGKVIQFAPDAKYDKLNVYTVAGYSKSFFDSTSIAIPVQSLDESQPRVVINDGVTQTFTIPGGVELKSVISGSGAVGFYTALSGGDLSSIDTGADSETALRLNSGAQTTQSVAIKNIVRGGSASSVINKVETSTDTSADSLIKLCFVSSEGGQFATIALGGASHGVSTVLEYVASC